MGIDLGTGGTAGVVTPLRSRCLFPLPAGNQTAVRKIVRKNLIIKGKALTLQSPLLLLCR